MRQATWIIFLLLSVVCTGQISTIENVSLVQEGKEKIWIDHLAQLRTAQAIGSRTSHTISLPMNGIMETFEVIPNDVLDAETIRLFPDILTFDLRLKADAKVYGALTLSTTGLYAAIFNMGKMISIYPDNKSGGNSHWIEYGIQPDIKKMQQFCGHDHSMDEMIKKPSPFNAGSRSKISMGSKRHTYDVAIVATGEFYVNNGNADAAVRTVVVNSVNQISAIFKNELAFTLRTSSSLIHLFKDPTTDPFDPAAGGRTDQAREAVAAQFNSSQYDIGHVFHQHANGDGWASGGVALLGSVCRNTGTPVVKAGGWSGSFSNVGNGWISLSAHEFAHQFNATHTFNGIGNSCTTAIESGSPSEETAVEIGSGTTLMSYNGLCNDDQNIPGSDVLDNYFHIVSLEQMYNYVYFDIGGTCGSPANSVNEIPEVIANPCNAVYKIPKNTPFYVEAMSNYKDNDQHTFCWEQIDEDGDNKNTQGKVGTDAANDSKAPIFRSYPPTSVPYRYFPALSSVVANIVNPFDILPNVARELNFNVAVRDNNTNGAVANDDIKIVVENNGPFVVTRPNGGENIMAGMSEVISWNTNGSNNLCSKIRIKLSIDGGLSFNLVLAEDVSYSAGSYNLTFPASVPATTSARIMLECADYSCFRIFNVSKSNFVINSTCLAPANDISPLTAKTLLQGDPGLNLKLKNNIGKIVSNFTGSVRSSDIAGSLVFFNGSPASCTVSSGNAVNGDLILFTVDITGSYTISHGASGSVLNLYQNAFTGTNCTNFVASSGTRPSGAGGIFTDASLTATLTAGRFYYLYISSFDSDVNSPAMPFNYNISFTKPSGANIYDGVKLPNGYAYTYVAVDKLTGKVAFYNNLSDFQAIGAGAYCVYGIAYLDSNSPDTWIGKSIIEIINAGNCIITSINCVNLVVQPACRITGITAATQTPCIASTNSFTQDLVITYDKAPATGSLNVGGQLFPITTSPQTVTLVNLDSDGQARDVVAFFTDAQDCAYEQENVFTAPVNCCPLTFDLGNDINKCQGETVLLFAGDNGVTYIWKKDGVVSPSTTSKTFPVSTSGVYEVEVTHATGCKRTDKITITFNPLPNVLLASNQKFCEGETYQLSATTSGAQTYLWYKDDDLMNVPSANSVEISSSGVYKLIAVSEFGCPGMDETFVSTLPKPIVNLFDDLKKCEGETVTLDAGPDGNVFQWYRDGNIINNADKQTYVVSQSGTYSVVVTNEALCKNDDEIKVDFFASPIVNDFPTLINICQGAPSNITGVAADYQTLQWYYDNNPILGSNSLSLTITNSGLYALEATNLAGCKTRKPVQVEIRSLPTLDLGGATLVSCEGNNVTLDGGQDGTTYKWSKDGTVLADNGRILTVALAGLYKVTVTNQFNCVNTDEITVSFIPGPSVALNGDATICEGESHVIVMTTNAPNPEIKWFNALGQIQGEIGSTLSVTEAGTYRVNVKGGTPACDVAKTVTISVNPRPALNLGNNRTLCDGDTPPVLNGGPGNTSFIWTLNGAPLAMTQNVTASSSGLYVVTVKNSFDCERTEQVRITYEAKPTLSMVNDSYDLCQGKSLAIDVVSDGTKFEWQKAGVVIPGQTTKSIIITDAGNYKVYITNAANCKNEKAFTVTSRANPIVDLGADFTLCPGENKTLNAGNHTMYLWSDNSSLPTLQVNAGEPAIVSTKKYLITVTNQFGCIAKDSVTATLYPVVKANIVADKPGVCNGEPVNLTASGGLVYLWTDPTGNTLSNTNQAITVASPLTTTTYIVAVSDGICPNNKDTKSIEIKVFEPNNITAGVDTCVIIGRTIKLGASGGSTYQWDNTNLIEGPSNIANPVVKPLVETIFGVTITDDNGCEFTDEVVVCVKEDNFKAVSIITPNGDGKNDELYFGNLNDYPDNTLKVFNRWGNLIFEAEGYQINGELFNGYRNGERLPADTYYYILTFDNQVIKSSLTILWD